MSRSSPDAILRPGAESWELWNLSGKEGARLESNVSVKALAAFRHIVMALPTRSILSVPLWVSPEGDPRELAELELTSRHLLRKTAELNCLPILHQDGRSLVLALASVDDPVAAEYFKKAETFEFPARLLSPGDADVLIWRELGSLCFAFYRNGACVFFASSGEGLPGPAFCGALTRNACRLHDEGVLLRLPAKLKMAGSFSREECEAIGHALRADWELEHPEQPPLIPEAPSNPAPPAAREEMVRRGHLRQWSFFAVIGLGFYALILLGVTADLVVRKIQLKNLNAQLAAMETNATDSQKMVSSWSELRTAVDPSSFAIDQLDAIASQIPGEQVRLTQYNYDKGRLVITGEAADVSQAYEFFEKVKKVPMLQDYDWTSRQPQLAGRNKVRFEMEGVRPDAKTSEE
ncbi:MAG: hypothetical protein RL630_171 [Verrucomicrobiota bacterium]|jgi:hypothetical protein